MQRTRLCLHFFFLLALVVTGNTSIAQPEWNAPLTEHSQPDLQGVWYFGTNTPFTRPDELGDQKVYTLDEAKKIEEDMRRTNKAQDLPLDPNRPAPEIGAYIGFEADYNFATKRNSLNQVNGQYRTSLVIEPANGQIPLRENFDDFHDDRKARGIETYDGPEAQDASERCLSGGLAVPSLYPMPWNANLQIVQNETYVMIMTEMNHDARIIRLSGSHDSNNFNSWMGDSIGLWEGDTLVVHTVNFRPEQSNFLMAMSEQFELTERFQRVSKTEIVYRYTVNDPLAYSQPFTVERTIALRGPDQLIFEVACHEGNYSMAGVLAGTRRVESKAKKKKKEEQKEEQEIGEQ